MNKKTRKVLKHSHLIFFLRIIKPIHKNKYRQLKKKVKKNIPNLEFYPNPYALHLALISKLTIVLTLTVMPTLT
jgi:hypothetical protein